MEFDQVDQAVALLERANANLEPELLPAPIARKLLETYARAEKLATLEWQRCLASSMMPASLPG